MTLGTVVPVPKTLKAAMKLSRLRKDPLHDFVQTVGGSKATLALLEQSTHDVDATVLAEKWKEMDLKNDGFDYIDLVKAVGMHPRDFVAIVSRCAYDFGKAMGDTIYAMHYPAMMAASMARSRQLDATEERKMHFQASRHIPTSKGIQILNQNTNTSGKDEPDRPGHAPSFRNTQRTVVRQLTE